MTDHELATLLFSIVLLLGAAHGFGYFFQRFGMPRVVGEIVGGIVLGPSLFGLLSPAGHALVFSGFPEQAKLLSTFYWFGLALLMFASGFHLRGHFSTGERGFVGLLVAAAAAIPLAVGWAVPDLFDLTSYWGTNHNPLAFQLIIAASVAVTSIPVISKIFTDLGLLDTKFARTVLAVATIEDVILWVVIAIATALASGKAVGPAGLAQSAGIAILFLALALTLGSLLVRLASGWHFNLVMKSSRSGYLLAICFTFAALASLLHVNVVFGALAAGIVVAALPEEKFGKAREQVTDVARGFFVPLYFALVGIKINLPHDFDLWLTLAFLAGTSVVKMACVFLASLAGRRSLFSSFNFALALNTRGGPGIVPGSLAYGLGLIDARLFTTMILTALLTSLVSGAWFAALVERNISVDRA
jgi:Kef-type K+ transport system membrane component KefB